MNVASGTGGGRMENGVVHTPHISARWQCGCVCVTFWRQDMRSWGTARSENATENAKGSQLPASCMHHTHSCTCACTHTIGYAGEEQNGAGGGGKRSLPATELDSSCECIVACLCTRKARSDHRPPRMPHQSRCDIEGPRRSPRHT